MAEQRLIDANALLEKADWYEEYNEITGDEISFRYIAASDVEEAPTVDAVEVVRCKDCKHLVLTDEGEHNPDDCVCDYWMTDGLTDDDFCSYGERRTDG